MPTLWGKLQFKEFDSHIRFKPKESGMVSDTCQKRFRDNFALRRHRQSYEGTSTMEMCTKWNGVFKHLKNQFINRKANKVNESICDICNVSFSEKKSMHIKRKHTTTKLYPCGCGKKLFVQIFFWETFKSELQKRGKDSLIISYLPGGTFCYIKQILIFHRFTFR